MAARSAANPSPGAASAYRWSDLDFEANLKDGIAIDWPIRYADIAPWYDYVEEFAGISGQAEGLPQLPDGKFLPPMEMTCVEQDFRDALSKHFDDRIMTIGRSAVLTRKFTKAALLATTAAYATAAASPNPISAA